MTLWQGLVLLALLTPPDVKLSDRERFPPRECAHASLTFNREYHAHIAARRSLDLRNEEYWSETLEETAALYEAWDWLHAAQEGEGKGEEYWLHSLRRLRELIGEEAYQQGTMPPCVPVQRFYVLEQVSANP